MAKGGKTDRPAAPQPVYGDDPHAPFVFFDGVPNYGAMEGVVTITLSAQTMLPGEDLTSVEVRHLAVAYLRCNRRAAVALRQAIDKALLIGAKTEGGEN